MSKETTIVNHYHLWPSWEAFAAIAAAAAFVSIMFGISGGFADPIAKQIRACDYLDTDELTKVCLEKIVVNAE